MYHTCGTLTNGSLWCWGLNNKGQLGDGTTTERHSPKRVGTGTSWNRSSQGGAHSCGMLSTGSLWCWGMNTDGQLGDGTVTERHSPKRVT